MLQKHQKAILYKDIFGEPLYFALNEHSYNLNTLENALSVYSNKSAVAVLRQLYESDGVYDGDLISPYGRDVLLQNDFCVKIIKNKNYGYQACNYRGAKALKIIEWIEKYVENDK